MATTTDKYIYGSILSRAAKLKIIPNKTQEARNWFRGVAAKKTGINQDKLFENSVLTNVPLPGRMYMYVYDAKTKKDLPYWDAFPLIFHVKTERDGFYGINLHYLDLGLRARLMDALYTTLNNERYDETTKLNISYNILKQAANFKLFRPCFKKYLFDHVRSKMIYIDPKEWDIALFLPLQRFQNASADQVWRDSYSDVYTKLKKRK